jgi:hypothetical protein
MAPGLALVRAESGVNAERLAAPAVESVLNAVKTSWHSLVPFTMVSVLAMTTFWPNSGSRYGPCQVLPRSYEQKKRDTPLFVFSMRMVIVKSGWVKSIGSLRSIDETGPDPCHTPG